MRLPTAACCKSGGAPSTLTSWTPSSTLADRLAEQLERLAHHALRSEVWDKALPYCRQAGAKAATRSAYEEAWAWFERALVACSISQSVATCVSKLLISGSTCGRAHPTRGVWARARLPA